MRKDNLLSCNREKKLIKILFEHYFFEINQGSILVFVLKKTCFPNIFVLK
jgi:hypothetical protein